MSHNFFYTVIRKYKEKGSELPKSVSNIIDIACEKRVDELREKVDTDGLQFFAEVCLKNVVKKRDWRLNHRKEIFSKFVTVADEALALLVLENNVELWFEVANGNCLQLSKKKGHSNEKEKRGEENTQATDETTSVAVYTGKGANCDGTKKGWSKEGIKRYNELYRKVKEIRGKSEYAKVEEEVKERWRNTQIGKNDAEIVEIVEIENFEEALNDFDYDNLTMV